MKKIIKAIVSSAIVLSMIILATSSILAKADTYIQAEQDIVETATNDGRFKTLVDALTAADLVDTLKGEGPFTVFAPTDEAFAKLPEGTLADLLKPENKDNLKDILLYHVFRGKLTADDISKLNGQELTLENGKKATITVRDGNIYIDDAKIIATDIQVKNGIIHVIDLVLQPK